MADDLKVNPTPIQRNTNDVAMELLKMHKSMVGLGSSDEIEYYFAKYYAVADVCNRTSSRDLKNLMSEELLKKLNIQ